MFWYFDFYESSKVHSFVSFYFYANETLLCLLYMSIIPFHDMSIEYFRMSFILPKSFHFVLWWCQKSIVFASLQSLQMTLVQNDHRPDENASPVKFCVVFCNIYLICLIKFNLQSFANVNSNTVTLCMCRQKRFLLTNFSICDALIENLDLEISWYTHSCTLRIGGSQTRQPFDLNFYRFML